MSTGGEVGSRLDAEELTLECRGLNLRALAFGERTNPPMLALHGWMDNAATFANLAPLLDNFYLVALDLPGHGRSDHRPRGGANFHADYALDAVHAANALNLDSFALMGHSMGGGVATLVAAAVPERIEHLILIDGLGPFTGAPESTASQLGQAIKQSLLPLSAKRQYESAEALLDRRANASSEIAREALAHIVRRNSVQVENDKGEVRWQWTTDPRLKQASPTRLTSEAVFHVLGEIKAPTLNLLASTGLLSQHPELEQRKAALTQATTMTIEGHHHFHLDGAVEYTAELINQFISTTPALSTSG